MRFGGIFAIAALVLGACSGDPAPKEPDPTPAPTSTATLPAMPDQATEDSPEGAAAFVDHWVDVFNYASQTGDVDELSALSSPDCEGCQSYIDLYRDTYEAGGYFKGGVWELGEVRIAEADDSTFVTTSYSADGATYRESSSSDEFQDPDESETISFELTRDNQWSVAQLGLGEVE